MIAGGTYRIPLICRKIISGVGASGIRTLASLSQRECSEKLDFLSFSNSLLFPHVLDLKDLYVAELTRKHISYRGQWVYFSGKQAYHFPCISLNRTEGEQHCTEKKGNSWNVFF